MFSLKRMEKMCGHNKSAVRQRESRLNGSNVQLLNMRISIDTLPPGEHRHTQWSSGGEWDICSYQASTHTQPAKHSTEPVCITVIFIQLNSSLKTESGGRGPCQEASPKLRWWLHVRVCPMDSNYYYYYYNYCQRCSAAVMEHWG